MAGLQKAISVPAILLVLLVLALSLLVLLPAARAQMTPTVQFSSANYSVSENIGSAVITVTLMPAATAKVTVQYSTSNGSAIAPGDFQQTIGQVSFDPNETSKTFSVPIVNDGTPEPIESFTVTLSMPNGANLGAPSTATVTIVDDDAPATVFFNSSSYTVSENIGVATISVKMTGAPTAPVTVSYGTSPGSAEEGKDYTAASGQLTWQPAEAGTIKTFTVPIIDDAKVEPMESLTLTLSNPSSNAALGSPATVMLSILDDDVPPPPVIVQTTGGTFTPDPAPIDTWVDATLTAKATRPAPSKGATLSSAAWAWKLVSAQYSTSSESGPWTDGAGSGYGYMITSAPGSPPDATYDYSKLVVSASFPAGGYWQMNCDAEVSYTDSAGAFFSGKQVAQAKGTPVEVKSLTVISGGPTQIGTTNNWACVCKPGGSPPAIVKVTVQPDTDTAAAAVTFTGGSAVADQPRQRSVDLFNSVKTEFKATAGKSSKELQVWAIWATIKIKDSGDWPGPPLEMPLGVLYKPDKAMATKAYGGICAIATVTPPGMNSVVKTKWDMKREIMTHYFKDGTKYDGHYQDVWIDDTSGPGVKTTTPDAEDKLYDLDAPDCSQYTGVKESVEINFNARQYVTWNDAVCSYRDDDNDCNKWYWQAQWKKTETPQIVSAAVVGGKNLDLSKYTTAKYPPP